MFWLLFREVITVYFQCCGYYPQIIPDFIEIGIVLLNISQPYLYSIPELDRKYGGKGCFEYPVSCQTTSISASPAEIFADGQTLVDNPGGVGVVGYVEEYHRMGMRQSNYHACVKVFQTLGRYHC